MTLLNDKQIARLAEKDIFLPYVGEKRRTLDNGTKAISYGLSQAGYDIRLSSVEFLVFTMDQWDGGTYEQDVKNFDVEPTAQNCLRNSRRLVLFRLASPLSWPWHQS
jgi:deoxycytidine triphosphate deaminase